jgi:hypothetical protein
MPLMQFKYLALRYIKLASKYQKDFPTNKLKTDFF